MLTLLYADAGLELVSKQLWKNSDVRAHARRRGKRPGELLLDISLHYRSMKRLKEWWKRGRPDILHVSLLVSQGSLLNREGLLRTFVHTYGGEILRVAPATRIPRNYNRFVGLMEQLLLHGKVPPRGEPLIERLDANLESLVKDLDPGIVVIMDEKGRYMEPRDLGMFLSRYERPLVVIGCFQRGEYSEEVRRLRGEYISIAPVPLDTWIIAAKVVSEVEDAIGLYKRG